MRGSKKRYLFSAAAVTLVTAWVDPGPLFEAPQGSFATTTAQRDGAAPMVADGRPATAPLPPHEVVAQTADDDATGVADATALDPYLGLDERSLRAALGPPLSQEQRPPAKLSSFRDRNCTLNVTLNPDVQTREFHALDYKVISDAHTPKRTRECALEFSTRFSQR